MAVVLLFLKSYWKHILIVIVLVTVTGILYKKVYNIGYDAATVECAAKLKDYEQKMNEYKENLNKRIIKIEEDSNTLSEEILTSKKDVKKDYVTILSTIKGKPLVIIEKDKCTPSTDFIRVYNEAVTRANQ
jgi:hypothetical protein